MNLSRRTLLWTAAVITAGAAATGAILKSVSASLGRKLTPEEKAFCGMTVEATEGPYWVSGMAALVSDNLNAANLPGPLIEVTGHVYEGLDNSKPIAGAEIDIWHADTTGNYHPNNNGPFTDYKPEELALRGLVKTAADGSYRFTSIIPGQYTNRARHFHFKIRAPGQPVLTTQLIVPAKPGDTLNFDTDDIAQGLPNCQQLTVDETTSSAKASFDFRV